MRKSCVLAILFLIIIACSDANDKYSPLVQGEWQLTKFYYAEKDLSSDGIYLVTNYQFTPK